MMRVGMTGYHKVCVFPGNVLFRQDIGRPSVLHDATAEEPCQIDSPLLTHMS